jgi:N-succinyldiaminopimelate aminotransferase
MNSRLERLERYPFEKLARLVEGVVPPQHLAPIKLSIGEPQHAPPQLILDALQGGAAQLGRYPPTVGGLELRTAAARWLERRFDLPADSVDAATMVLPVNGTREALFGFIQSAVNAGAEALVCMPNPFYQIYEGATLLAGATPHFLDTSAATGYVPDLGSVPARVWQRCAVLVVCSPGNPTGAVLGLEALAQALALASQYDFVVAADECYADIYLEEGSPPPSLLQAALASGHARFERCIVFHSLSKRSSVPGLRSGFIAGDPELVARFLLYRTYQGGAMSPLVQGASTAAWNDDAHAKDNRRRYREKYDRVLPILQSVLEVERPAGAFYLWPEVGGNDERFARELYAACNLLVLPGSYLARAGAAGNPGAGRVRVSLTATLEECVEAAERIRDFL